MKSRGIIFACLALVFALLLAGNVRAAAGTHPGISIACATGSSSISSTGLLRSYDMETILSSKARDFASTHDDATASGGVTIGGITGKFGKSTDFDGTNDALSGTTPTTPSAYTFGLYLYPRTTGAKIALALGGPGGTGNTYVSYGIIAANKFTAADGTSLTTSAATYAVNTWHSIIVTDNGATLTLRVDGTASSTADIDGLSAWTGLNMGMFNSNLFYDGYIDEVSIWNRVLSSDEILTYEAGPNGSCIAPPTVLTNAATVILCNGAKLNGNLTSKGTASIVAVGFQYGKSPTLTNATNHTVSANATTGLFNDTVTGLDPSTFYYFRAWANGADGYANGTILYFETTACAVVCVADLSAPNLAIMVILGVSAILVVVLGFAIDNFIAIMVGGLVAVLVSFQSYVLTCNVAVSIVLVAFGILLLVLPVPKLLENR